MAKDDVYKDEPIDRKQAVEELLKRVSGVKRAADALWDDITPVEGIKPLQQSLFSLEEDSFFSTPWKSPLGKISPAQAQALQVDDDALRELKELRQQWKSLRGQSKEETFYLQAKLAERFEPPGLPAEPFECYYPCYNDMSLAQLYSYFTFRAAFRRGERANVSTSLVFVLIYELLMLVGTCDAEESWRMLCRVKDYYSAERRAVRNYLSQWMKDFVVVNNLSEHIPEAFGEQLKEDEWVQNLLLIGKGTDEEMWRAFPLASSFNIYNTAFSKKHPDIAMRVAGKVMRALERQSMEETKVGFAERHLVLRRNECRYMYANAVAWKPPQKGERIFEVDSVRRYVLRRGTWMLEYYIPLVRKHSYKTSLADILHDTDCLLRRAMRFKPYTATRISEPEFETLVVKCIAEYAEEVKARRKKEALDKVKIDFSKLGCIRNDADVVRNALTVEGGTEDATAPWHANDEIKEDGAADPHTHHSPQAPLADTPLEDVQLTDDERQFLSLLLSHGNWKTLAKERRLMPSLLEENINNALYDRFGDNVLEEGDNGPQVVEDYAEALRALFFATNN
ncbi:MAG: TerB N-terminal domain-containing protein [Bacteroidales bacterium]|nr:TerB N-terminal domain-containing protein [Bacteroidales bacterium]